MINDVAALIRFHLLIQGVAGHADGGGMWGGQGSMEGNELQMQNVRASKVSGGWE